MKIVFTCNRLGLGGAERVICNFANRMVSDGIETRIICLDILDGFHYSIEENVKVIQLDEYYKNHRFTLKRKIAGIKNLWRLRSTLKEERPDVVISFYTRQNCYSILLCKLLQIPVIAAEREHFFTCDSKVNRFLRKLFYPRADGFIHQTEWARSYLREHCGIKCDDIVLPNPIWMKEYPERNVVSKSIVSVGRLEEQKNYKGLIRAFKGVIDAIPEATLTIYGEGMQRQELQSLIDSLGLHESILLFGMTNNILECYARADVFVLFSHGEGYPNALMEALAIGVPCIASDCPVGGPADMIKNGYNGILISLDDEVMLTKELIALINDVTKKKEFSIGAKEIQITNSFDRIYTSLIAYINKVNK